MKIIMTNDQMEKCIDVLGQLEETGKFGYAIAKNLRKLKDEAKEYLELKSKLLKEYGVLSEDGKTATVSGDNLPKFIGELGDIPMIEQEVDVLQVDAEIFTSGSLTSTQMEALLWMVAD